MIAMVRKIEENYMVHFRLSCLERDKVLNHTSVIFPTISHCNDYLRGSKTNRLEGCYS